MEEAFTPLCQLKDGEYTPNLKVRGIIKNDIGQFKCDLGDKDFAMTFTISDCVPSPTPVDRHVILYSETRDWLPDPKEGDYIEISKAEFSRHHRHGDQIRASSRKGAKWAVRTEPPPPPVLPSTHGSTISSPIPPWTKIGSNTISHDSTMAPSISGSSRHPHGSSNISLQTSPLTETGSERRTHIQEPTPALGNRVPGPEPCSVNNVDNDPALGNRVPGPGPCPVNNVDNGPALGNRVPRPEPCPVNNVDNDERRIMVDLQLTVQLTIQKSG